MTMISVFKKKKKTKKKKKKKNRAAYTNISALRMSSRKSNNKKRARITNKSRRSWTVKEKLMIICYYEQTNNVRATARRFEIEPKQVRDWVSKKDELLNTAPYLLTLNHGKQAQYPMLEERLVEWINGRRNEQNAVTQNMVVKKAKALAQTNEFKNVYPDIGNCRFSMSWLS